MAAQPPQLEWPQTTMLSTFSACTAYSTAEVVATYSWVLR